MYYCSIVSESALFCLQHTHTISLWSKELLVYSISELTYLFNFYFNNLSLDSFIFHDKSGSTLRNSKDKLGFNE